MKLSLAVAVALVFCASSAFGAELVINGGFDDQLNIQASSATITASAGNAGLWQQAATWGYSALGGNPDGAMTGTSGGNDAMTQIFAMPADGTAMTFSFDFKTDSTMWVDAFYMAEGQSFDSSWNTPPDHTGFSELQLESTNGVWVNSGLLSMTADAGYDYVGITLWSGNNTFVDNVSVTAVPEPATMSVLALGALGLLRRRR